RVAGGGGFARRGRSAAAPGQQRGCQRGAQRKTQQFFHGSFPLSKRRPAAALMKKATAQTSRPSCTVAILAQYFNTYGRRMQALRPLWGAFFRSRLTTRPDARMMVRVQQTNGTNPLCSSVTPAPATLRRLPPS